MDRLTRIVLRAYPKTIRDEFAEDLRRALDARRADYTRRFGPVGPPVTLIMGLVDAVTARRDWRRSSQASSGDAVGRPESWIAAMRDDARYALRAWRRAPLFFAGVILTLALGIAATAAVFTLLEAVAWRPLPYGDQDRLVMLWRSPVVSRPSWRYAATPALLFGWRREGADVVDLAGLKESTSLEAAMDIETPQGAERLDGALATPNFFDVLGARAAAGRLFSDADAAAGDTDLVVLSHALWVRAFGSSPAVIGAPLTLTTGRGRGRAPRTFRVVGVLPRGFHFNYETRVEVWTMQPWESIAREEPHAIGYRVVGRLRPGATPVSAEAHLTAAYASIDPRQSALPDDRRMTVRLEPIADWVEGDARPTLALLGGVAGVLLLITCGTVAGALLIRVTERRRELSLRTALGATRGRLLRQLLLEGLALAAAGTACGVVVAAASLPWLRSLVPVELPRADELALHATLLPFSLVLIVVVTLVASAAPAWRGARADLIAALKASSGTVSADRVTTRWRTLLVAAQSALATVLLLAASLLLVSFWQIGRTTLGFAADDVIAVELRLLGEQYRSAGLLRQFQEQLVARISAIPGVARVGLTSAVPFRGVDWTWNLDLPPGFESRLRSANGRQVDPAYFSIMQIPLVRGRLITDADVAGAPDVAVVSEGFARRAFGEEDALGKTIVYNKPLTIVGVVADTRYRRHDVDPYPAVYVARAQSPAELICVLVKPATPGANLAAAIRAAIRDVDSSTPAMSIATIGQILDDSTAGRRFYTVATALFAALALILTLAGILVIVGRAVVERKQELAIRSALGASTPRLRRLLVRQGLLPVIAGAGTGLVAATLAAPMLAPFLFRTAPRDPWILVAVAATILAAGAMAAALPARRLTRATSVHVLRGE